MEGSTRGGRSGLRGRGRNFRPRLQCQICSRFGHVAQRCYYRYHRDDSSSMQVQLPNPRGSGDGGWSSQPNTRPRISNLGQNYYGNNVGQNCFGVGQNNGVSGQNVCADGYNGFLEQRAGNNVGQNWFRGGQTNCVSGQNVCADGYNCAGPNVGLHGWLRPGSREFRPPTNGPHDVGSPDGINGSFGPTDIGPNAPLGPNAPIRPTNPMLNHVQLGSSTPTDNAAVPWRTKPRARVFSASNPCFGLPRLGDLHASDSSDLSISGSHINSTQYGVSGDESDSPVPGTVGTSSWYPDSGASNHVCRDSSALHNAVPYSGQRDSGDFDEGAYS
ncbi:hypothetical protein ES288_D12G229900v1 [Gossypium darwinii]|uniref:Uncharacterized protein n=1 Tax=Gossypium darwinii TaxID=34276 RepID=A0A5D2ACQ7_GOSDA|nr:hypothetical protein ES288_D12G229900v1 [Gossypium darwinii]